PGIPESLREKAIQADYSTQGTGGLGLAIVQAIVQAHGGSLTITEATDGGARFELTWFEIPPIPTES
ncbi:MAG: ATP-binding protein, partial [Halobacteriaceae archaeon]